MRVNIYLLLVLCILNLLLGIGIEKTKNEASKKELIEKVTTFAALSMMKQYIDLQLGERQDLSIEEIRKETVEIYK